MQLIKINLFLVLFWAFLRRYRSGSIYISWNRSAIFAAWPGWLAGIIVFLWVLVFPGQAANGPGLLYCVRLLFLVYIHNGPLKSNDLGRKHQYFRTSPTPPRITKRRPDYDKLMSKNYSIPAGHVHILPKQSDLIDNFLYQRPQDFFFHWRLAVFSIFSQFCIFIFIISLAG